VTSDRAELVDRVRRALATGPPLRLAVLFGSSARGVIRADSDLDVGIVPRDPDLSLATELDLQAELERTCRRPVDLVRLDRASTLVRWQVARQASPVLADPPFEFPAFVARATLEWADFAEVVAPVTDRYRSRLIADRDPAVTDPVLVVRKLAALEEHCARARRRRPESLEALRANVDLQDALAMSLFVAIQEAVDIAFHIVADEGWGVPGSYAEGFATLSDRGVIDRALAGDLARVVGVRHRIAHGYASIDLDRLWAELPAGLDALRRYASAVAAFLPRPG
jgi:uncharacterized protein YutE (UPF0331/DUF86 family)/predicted nucleotidyltransferase